MRLPIFAALFGTAVLLAPPPMRAQAYAAPGYYVETPEVHLGSATEPSVLQIPPLLIEQPGLPIPPPPLADEYESANQPPMCAPAQFDYLVAPTGELFPGSMADSSISLGEYARELRSHKGEGPPPIHLDIHSLPAE
jgi:hypothetical protein